MCLGSKTLPSNASCSWAALLSGQKFTGICWGILFLLKFLQLVWATIGVCAHGWFVYLSVNLTTLQRQHVQYSKCGSGSSPAPKTTFFFSSVFPMTGIKAPGNCCPCTFISIGILVSLKKGIKFSVKICPTKTQNAFSYYSLKSLDSDFFGNCFQHFLFLCHLWFRENPKCFLQCDGQVSIIPSLL